MRTVNLSILATAFSGRAKEESNANCRGIAGLLNSGAAGDEGGSDGRAPS
jgi:hypothetical protein